MGCDYYLDQFFGIKFDITKVSHKKYDEIISNLKYFKDFREDTFNGEYIKFKGIIVLKYSEKVIFEGRKQHYIQCYMKKDDTPLSENIMLYDNYKLLEPIKLDDVKLSKETYKYIPLNEQENEEIKNEYNYLRENLEIQFSGMIEIGIVDY
jgi:hypothetical protein